MKTPSRLLATLFLLAAAGVLVALGLLVATLGPAPLVLYVVLVLCLVGVGIRAARRQVRAQQAAARGGRTCTCCTTTVHDPVQVR